MMFSDLTQVNVPFGLLDRETQEALKAHGGPYEFASPENNWAWLPVSATRPMWGNSRVYRVKPAPPKPREWWINLPASDDKTVIVVLHNSYSSADVGRRNVRGVIMDDDARIIHVREVLP